MTKKQITTLLLYSQNYSMPKIAEQMGVCLTTIRQRLAALKVRHKREFNNALSIRGVYKRNRDAIRDTSPFSAYHKVYENGKYIGLEDTVTDKGY